MGLPTAPDNTKTSEVGSAIRSTLIWNVVTMAFAQIALAGIFLLLAARLDPVTFLRLVGRDVREHPDNWAHDIEASPDLGRDLARLSRALSQSVAALAREGGRAT